MRNENETSPHYDVDANFYARFLDPYMKYTSGLYTEGISTFEAAIVNMLDRHVGVALGYRAPRVLEIGPGWGALFRRLRESGHPFSYTAVNPSRAQNAYIRAQIDASVRICEATFEAAEGLEGPYDVIYLIGSFCHMRDKPQQVRRLAQLLAPGGHLVFEDTYFISDRIRQAHGARTETRYVQQEVFGFAEINSFPEFVNLLAENRLLVDYVLDHSSSYARTIDTWMGRMAALSSEQFPLTASYQKYMGIFQKGWGKTIANYLVHVKHMGPVVLPKTAAR